MSKNVIWNYFKKVDSDQSKAQCVECGKLYSLGSDKPRQQTTSGLKFHLSLHHKEIHALYLKRAMENESAEACKKAKLTESAAKTVLPNFVQPSLQEFKASRMLWPDDHVSSKAVDKAIMDLIIVDMLPYTVVEGDAFKRLNFADPNAAHRYRLKSEKYFRTTLMPATYDKVALHVRKLLTEADWISFTTDGWSNPTKSCSLLSFTGHFVHGAIRRKVILNAMVLEEDHTAVYLATKLKEAMKTWGIESKIHLGVRDNAANMVSAMRHAEVDDFGCLSHTIQLVLHDALFTQTSVENVVKKARKIVTHFKHSEQACRHLSEYQLSREVPQHKLIQDVETRWNSTYLMMERLCEQRKAINLFSLERGGIDTLTTSEWELTDRVVSLLRPFYAATLEICADDACISIAIPIVAMLTGKLEITPSDQGLKQMKGALRDATTRRFASLKTSPHCTAATLLDPRFKDAYFGEQERESARNTVLEFLHAQDSNRNTNEEPDSDIPSCSQLNTAEPVPSTDLWDAHDSLAPATESIEGSTGRVVPGYEQQLDAYLQQSRVPRTTDIYSYWHNSQYPLLEMAARKYLSAPPTSVASEQLFSSAGQIYADRRSNLLGENAEQLLFLAYNIRLLGFTY